VDLADFESISLTPSSAAFTILRVSVLPLSTRIAHMAARDQKAQTVYLLLVTFLAVICMVGWGYCAFTISTQRALATEWQEKANKKDVEFRALNSQKQIMSRMIGTEPLSASEYKLLVDSDNSDVIKNAATQYEKDMALFGPTVTDDQKNYSTLVSTLMQEVRVRNQQVADAAKKLAEASDENKAVMQREREAAANEKKRADGLESQLANERADFTTKLEATQKVSEEANKKLTLATQNHAQEKNKLGGEIEKLKGESAELRKLNLALREQVDQLRNEEIQTPQGAITGVSKDSRSVWVNLGKRDKLRNGIRFIVLDPDQSRISEATRKAMIEIVDVQESLSRARVIEDDNANPIVEGDLVYSVSWEFGKGLQFALLGKMDIDKNGTDDREAVKELIRQAGGSVVEELYPDGRQAGKMTLDTHWVVIGEAYNSAMTETRPSAFVEKYADMLRRSKDMAISQINLDKFMSFLRANTDDRAIPMGDAVNPDDLSVKEVMPSTPGMVADIYKKDPKAAIKVPEIGK
jgi:hypothetical protein